MSRRSGSASAFSYAIASDMRSKCTTCCQQGNGKAESHEWRTPPPSPSSRTRAEGLQRSYSAGRRRPMVQLPTGAGKTRLAAEIIRGALAKGKRVAFVVPALSLIDQTVAFARARERVAHG
jgi:primosomal protein N'